MSTNCMVTVTIELGHQANLLKERSPDGFTHDWNVFVRGYEDSKIENFVEKVVFKLHKTFKTPTRVISEPPYRVTECGYAGFHLPIEIHFKNKQTPRKIPFTYDLFLNVPGTPPVNNVRYEKLKFQNPTPEFKAKLIRGGGIEQGSDGVPVQRPFPELLSSSAKNVLEKKTKSSSSTKEKHKKVKKVKKSPVRPASPDSLPSLSPTSSEDEEEKSPPVKEWIPASSQSKKEFSTKKESPPIEKYKAKPESSSHKSKHSSSERDNKDSYKPYKDKEKNSSSHHRDESRKEKEHKSHKSNKDSYDKHKEREGSHSSSKSSSSSHGEKSSSHKEKSSHSEKSSSHGDKKSSSHSSGKEKLPGKSKEKRTEEGSSSSSSSSSKKHKSSHKSKEKDDKSSSKHKTKESNSSPLDTSSEKPKKPKEESSKSKITVERERLSKPSTKRPSTSPLLEYEIEKKKVKRSSSVGSEDRVSSKSEKEKIPTSDKKEAKVKESKSSSLDIKHKHSKSKSSDKHKSSSTNSIHSNEGKTKSSKDHNSIEKSSSSASKFKGKIPKLEKSDSVTKAEQLAMTADFQPKLLLSPVRSRSDDEEETPASASRYKKTTKSHSSDESLSSLSSSDDSDKSDTEDVKPKNIVSDLVDSDSGSEEESLPAKVEPKEVKPLYSHTSSSFSSKNNKKQSGLSSVDKSEKYSTGIKRTDSVLRKENKESGSNEGKRKCASDVSGGDCPENVSPNGLDVLAPNGIPMGELFAINEKIEQAQDNEDVDLLNKVVDIIEESADYDMDDVAFSFNICSLEKHLVAQIQNILRE